MDDKSCQANLGRVLKCNKACQTTLRDTKDESMQEKGSYMRDAVKSKRVEVY